MKTEYIITWPMPQDYDPHPMLRTLPSPIGARMVEIYNYAVRENEFYFRDNHTDLKTAGQAIKILIDEALKHTKQITIRTL